MHLFHSNTHTYTDVMSVIVYRNIGNTLQLPHTNSEHINVPITGPLLGESTGHR